MAWTLPTGIFFACIALGLISLTVIELRWPTVSRKGYLPIVTTRGDRVFISLLTAAYLHLSWVALLPGPLWLASIASIIAAMLILRWG